MAKIDKSVRPFSGKDEWGYIFGDMAGSFVNLYVDAYFLTFCTYALGISASFMAGLFPVVRLLDAFDDPMIGSFPDRWHLGKKKTDQMYTEMAQRRNAQHQATKKIDLHLHLTPFQIPKIGKLNLTSGANMLPHLEELGIEKGVLMSGSESGLPFGTNKANKKLCDQFPDRYAWMCNLNPKSREPVFDRLARYKAQGAIGIGELTVNRRLDDPFLQEVFAAAEKLEMPITIHMSPEVGYSYGVVDEPGLPLLEDVLKKYPNLKILGHSQTFWIEMSADAPKDKENRNSWGDGPVVPGGRVPELFGKYPNLYGDLSANSGSRAVMRDPEFGLAFLETYADRLFFATDMVNKDMVFPLGQWLDQMVSEGKLSQESYEKIVRGNARRIFGL